MFALPRLFSLVQFWGHLSEFCPRETEQRDSDIAYLDHSSFLSSIHPFLQETNRAILNIDASVRKVVTLARQQYRPDKLNPALANLEDAANHSINLQEELEGNLRCDNMYRSVNKRPPPLQQPYS